MTHLNSQCEDSIPSGFFEKHPSGNTANGERTHAADDCEAECGVQARFELPLVLLEGEHRNCEGGQEDQEPSDPMGPHRHSHVHLQISAR